MVDFKEDERLNTLNHSCAHVMAQAVKHLYPNAKFWVGPVVKEGFYYDIDLGDTRGVAFLFLFTHREEAGKKEYSYWNDCFQCFHVLVVFS